LDCGKILAVVACDNKNAFAHYVATVVAVWKKDYERWASEGDEALSLDPNFALAMMTRGMLHIYTGEPERAIPYILRAMRLLRIRWTQKNSPRAFARQA